MKPFMSQHCEEQTLWWVVGVYGLTLLFWLCSLVVLLLRWRSRAFQDLVRYSGRSLASTVVPHERGRRELQTRLAPRVMAWVHHSPLGRVRIARRTSFLLFYTVGCLSVLARLAVDTLTRGPRARLMTAELQPLLCFGFHCVWRLAETLWLFHFRPKAEDHVSLFAAVAGAVFYLFAAVSCDPAGLMVRRGVSITGGVGLPPRHGRVLTVLVKVLGIAWVLIQLLQAWAHRSLAQLRAPCGRAHARGSQSHAMECARGAKGAESGAEDDPATPGSPLEARALAILEETLREAMKSSTGPTPATNALAHGGRLVRYHLPTAGNPLFAHVLEPHYGCEVVMYVLNLASTVAILATYRGACEEAGRRVAGYDGGSIVVVGCALGVLVFTLINLALTAEEHRQFWLTANRERRRAQAVVDAYYTRTRSTPGLTSEEEAARRACARALREEKLPPFNIVYGLW